MEKIGLNELRESFLAFFESKGHLRLKSAPLIPQNDNSLLLINSGMAPFKPYFTGEITPPAPRAATCQKCIRTPDIENVGKNSRHGTYFEMMGNFSFGDYFKRDAQKWAWEYITEVIKLPVDKIFVSVYLDDDESYDIWVDEIGVDPSHMVRLGKKDNFWEIGAGPCGPCSEIYFDRGEKYGCGLPDCAPGCDCDRYVEFWNLVFTQLNNDGAGNYTPLAKKNIDTGMGLERMACIVQGVETLFDVDTIASITKHVSRLTGVEYNTDPQKDISLRIITDHIRSTTMMICDGVMPSNMGRGYVLRRLLRRAARHGRLLDMREPFLHGVCETVIRENEGVYPELREKEQFIKTVILNEEERFGATIGAGLVKLEEMIAKLKSSESVVLPGEDAFRLYDTDGFPIDLTVEILDEHGLTVAREDFEALMTAQKKRARAARGDTSGLGWESDNAAIKHLPATTFVGYSADRCESKVLALVAAGQGVDSAEEGERVTLVAEASPFYAESGGQTADTGVISTPSAKLGVIDVRKTPDGKYLHVCDVVSGEIKCGETVELAVDAERRQAIRRAHSSTHLLHRALRDTLGGHVTQGGSLVEPDKLRFDFSHFSQMTPKQLGEVEDAVNRAVLKGLCVSAGEMAIAEAKEQGAMALFGEKYGDIVRVVKMGDYSTELCGGTHVENTAKIGLFKIMSEASVASGTRRIEAVCGMESLDALRALEQISILAAAAAKTTPSDLVRRVGQLVEEIRSEARAKEALEGKLARLRAIELLSGAKDVNGVKVLAAKLDEKTVDGLRAISDSLRDREAGLVCVLAGVTDENKIVIVAACGKLAVARGAHSGNIVKQVAGLCGGGGGGKPDSASAGGNDVSRLDAALDAVAGIVGGMLK